METQSTSNRTVSPVPVLVAAVAAGAILQSIIVLIVLMITYPGGYRLAEYSISMLGSHYSQANGARNLIGHDIGLISYLLLGAGTVVVGVRLASLSGGGRADGSLRLHCLRQSSRRPDRYWDRSSRTIRTTRPTCSCPISSRQS